MSIEEIVGKIDDLMINQKSTLTFEECVTYTGLSKSYLYKLTSTGGIPCYKPLGKILYFDKDEIDEWLQRNPNHYVDDEKIEVEASNYIARKGRLS